MSYIVKRQDRSYVVAYDGLDPLTGRERRRWHPIGHDRSEAEQLAARLDHDRDATPTAPAGPAAFGEFLTNTWIPHKRRQVRATTAYRYAWFVDRYIQPAIGDIPLRRLRADHLDTLYDTLANTGGRDGNGLAPKTVLEVHAVTRRLVDRNVAHHTRSRRRPPASGAARSWTLPNSARSSPPHVASASTRHCTSPRTQECAAAKSSASNGPTSASPTPDCRCHAHCRTSADAPSSSV